MGLPFFFLINLLLIAISIYLLGKGESWGHPKPRQGRPPGPPFLLQFQYTFWEKGKVGDTPNPARGDPLDPLSPPGLLILHYTLWKKGKVGDTPNPARGDPLDLLSPPGLLILHYERRSDLREAADSMKRDSLSRAMHIHILA